MKQALVIIMFFVFVSSGQTIAQTIIISTGRGIVSNSSFSEDNPATIPVFVGLDYFQNKTFSFSSSLGYSNSMFNYSPEFSAAYMRFSNYGDVNIIQSKNEDKFPFSDAVFLGVGGHLSLNLSDSDMENLNLKKVSWGPLIRFGIKISFSRLHLSISHNVYFNVQGIGNYENINIPGTSGLILASIGYDLK